MVFESISVWLIQCCCNCEPREEILLLSSSCLPPHRFSSFSEKGNNGIPEIGTGEDGLESAGAEPLSGTALSALSGLQC